MRCKNGHDLSNPRNFSMQQRQTGVFLECLPCKRQRRKDRQRRSQQRNRAGHCSDFVANEVENVLNGTPQAPIEIHRALQDDYGSISMRYVYKALRRLVDEGRAERAGAVDTAGHVLLGQGGYVRKENRNG